MPKAVKKSKTSSNQQPYDAFINNSQFKSNATATAASPIFKFSQAPSLPTKRAQVIKVAQTNSCPAFTKRGHNWVVNTNRRDGECQASSLIFEASSPSDSLGHIICKEVASFDALKKSLQITSLVVRNDTLEKPFDIALALIRSVESYAKTKGIDYISVLPTPSRKKFFMDALYTNTFDSSSALYKVFKDGPSANSAIDYSPDSSLAISYIRKWTTMVYFAFNRALRQSSLTPEYIRFYIGLLTYFRKYGIEAPFEKGVKDVLQLDASGNLYRGISPADRDDENSSAMELFKNGKLEDNGFIAFSKNAKQSQGFAKKGRGRGMFLIFDVLTDFANGTHLVDIEPISTFSAEREVLGLPGTIELIEQIETDTEKFDTWRARYVPKQLDGLDREANVMLESMEKSRKELQEEMKKYPPLIPGQSALIPKDSFTLASTLAENMVGGAFTDNPLMYAKLGKDTQKDAHLNIQGKLAVYYNIIHGDFVIHKVETIITRTNLTDTISYLDAKQERQRIIVKEWAALRKHAAQTSSPIDVILAKADSPALLTNISVAILNPTTKRIESWRYGDLDSLPDVMKNGVAFAEALKRYALKK